MKENISYLLVGYQKGIHCKKEYLTIGQELKLLGIFATEKDANEESIYIKNQNQDIDTIIFVFASGA